jgi:divalent metal cation (Fe/Co/Zn/Cd) transporter
MGQEQALSQNGRRLAYALVGGTLIYNVFEGVIAIASGVAASSIILVTFGIDSYLEVVAAGAVLWRLAAPDDEIGEQREERALRIVGWSFMLLAAAVVLQALLALGGSSGAETSRVGLTLLLVSLFVMPVVSIAKLWAAARWTIPSLAAEARETIACSYLSLTALVGVVGTALVGWWWLDPAFALLMVPWLIKEGLEGIRGDACFDGAVLCFCRECWFGSRDCPASCCAVAA